ncbi:hypothetical protein PR048_009895 [Dryococelus australis]|uniref:Uncharacterized protein n=1 Tax=Dryococelus australis TaxID=614101 RepID=A0ABQ9I168_9NEOP|nr:hypothetical protein PR048_009895 [Dryococelus australis]
MLGCTNIFPDQRSNDPSSEPGSCLILVPIGRGCIAVRARLPSRRTRFDARRGRFRVFRMWESCRAMPLVGGFSRGSAVPLSGAAPYSPCFTLIGYQDADSTSVGLRVNMCESVATCNPQRFQATLNAYVERRCCGGLESVGMKRGDEVRWKGEGKREIPEKIRAAVLHWLERSPPTKANRVRFLEGSLSEFRTLESCRTTPLVGGFSRGISHFPSLAYRRCSTNRFILIGSQCLDFGSPLVDDRPIMNAVKHRIVPGVVLTNRTMMSSNIDTNRTGALAVVDIGQGASDKQAGSRETESDAGSLRDAANRDPPQHSPGMISENHVKQKSGWPDRESNPGPSKFESSELVNTTPPRSVPKQWKSTLIYGLIKLNTGLEGRDGKKRLRAYRLREPDDKNLLNHENLSHDCMLLRRSSAKAAGISPEPNSNAGYGRHGTTENQTEPPRWRNLGLPA